MQYLHFNESSNSHSHDWQLLSQKPSNLLYVTSTLHYALEMSASSAYLDLRSDVNELKRRIKMREQSESRCSLNVRLATYRQRLRACVRAGGRHFEQEMQR